MRSRLSIPLYRVRVCYVFSVWRDLMYDVDDTGSEAERQAAAQRPARSRAPTTHQTAACALLVRHGAGCSFAGAGSSSLPLSCRLASCHEPLGSELRLASLEWRSDSERWRLATLSQ